LKTFENASPDLVRGRIFDAFSKEEKGGRNVEKS
jgi:hypothetical protein